MILFKFKSKPETREGFPCTAFRKVVQIERVKPWGFILGFDDQYELEGKWNTHHASGHQLGVFGPLSFGPQHDYYDGPHCSFSLGYIHFLWHGSIKNGWCKKCYPDEPK